MVADFWAMRSTGVKSVILDFVTPVNVKIGKMAISNTSPTNHLSITAIPAPVLSKAKCFISPNVIDKISISGAPFL